VSTLDKLTDRVLARLGLDLDFSIRIGRAPFNAITEDLFLGARPDRKHVPQLKEAGITHVVSCLRDDDLAMVAFLKDDFHSLFIPMHDGVHEDIASAFPAFFDFVRTAPEQHARAKVLVHCEGGVSRSATLATALLMQRSRKQFFAVYCDVRAKRAEVLPNIGFASQLQRLELETHPRARGDLSVSSLARYLREVCMVPVELETLQSVLHRHDYDAWRTIQAIFGDEIPRVIQGVRL
jgi:protein-tyrosine phosphatase